MEIVTETAAALIEAAAAAAMAEAFETAKAARAAYLTSRTDAARVLSDAAAAAFEEARITYLHAAERLAAARGKVSAAA